MSLKHEHNPIRPGAFYAPPPPPPIKFLKIFESVQVSSSYFVDFPKI